MKFFVKAGRLFLYLVVLCLFSTLCAFYTHPTFVKQELSFIIPDFKGANFFFKKNVNCQEYQAVSPDLNDKHADYIWNSAYQKFGEPLKYASEIKPHYRNGSLVLIESNDLYVVDTLYYSYAFLTPKAKMLLDEIALNFQKKIANTIYKNAKIHVTSLLRTFHSVKKLRRWNRNSLRISSHLHGTTFDLDYDDFETSDSLDHFQTLYLKETLATVLKELKMDKKCFVTYETRQSCFHVVNRRE